MSLTIITPTLNRVGFLPQAIESARQPSKTKIEHIIVDGGSTDGTLDLLGKYDHLVLISAPDKGMYDAINKGLRANSGEVIGFLNSDDFYAQNIFSSIMQVFTEHPGISAVMGGVKVLRSTADNRMELVKEVDPIAPKVLPGKLATDAVYFNSWFFRRSLFDEIGLLDDRYQIAADREFLFRFVARGGQYRTFNQLIYNYRDHTGSMTFGPRNIIEAREEDIHIAEQYFHDPSSPLVMKQAAQSLHLQASRSLFRSYLQTGQIRQGLKIATEGIRYNRTWLFSAVERMFTRLRSR